jgi:hypothetical protein
MKIELAERVTIDHDEQFHIHKASQVLNQIFDNMTESGLLDEQGFPEIIESLLVNALLVEDSRVDSIFNILNDDMRRRIQSEIMIRWGKMKYE